MRPVGGWPRSLSAAFARRWRRSIQTRVVVSTLLVSAAVVALLGVYLQHRLTDGLLQARVRASLTDLDAGLATAQARLGAAYPSPNAVSDATVDAVFDELDRGSPAGLYDVALLTTATSASGRISAGVDEGDIPAALQSAVGGGHEAYAFTTLHYRDGRQEPGLVAGGPVSADSTYQLYYFFPLQQDAQTISFVRRTLFGAGAALVALLAGIAGLVTRQVVTPVRAAARTARRLAAGLLDERMTVRGADELAALGTSFNRMATSLQAHIRKLEDLSRLQQRFVSDVSHELRTPLTTVRMAADVLHDEREGFPPAVARSAELLHAELGRFESLLTDLLEISRHDAGVVVLEREPVDLRQVLTAALGSCRALVDARGSAVSLSLPPEPVVAEVEGRRIERVLRNLIANAAEFGDGRPLEIALRGDGVTAAITVRDHGVGLGPGEPEHVFERFWRADPARARTTGGTGLGLAIAWEDARLHGGRLEAWGAPGSGSVFRLALPYRAGDTAGEPPLPLVPDRTAALTGGVEA